MFYGLPVALQGLISTLLWSTGPTEPTLSAVTFHLRHQHAVLNDSQILFSDIQPGASFGADESQFMIQTTNARIPRPNSQDEFMAARWNRQPGMTPAVDWGDWEVPTPDVSKRSTLLQLSKMAFNAYAADNRTLSEWYDLGDEWTSLPHGWEPEADGMRGHVFVSQDNSTVVISIKGTSAGWLVGGGGPTVGKDKKNDNLLFSCCCARVGPTWSTVCGCYDSGYRCDIDCVEEAMKDQSLFYSLGLNLYNNVAYMYPNAAIWLTGHSLGGGLSALLGLTFGAPVIAFEAPAERMASQRLHLPRPPSINHITHVYNTADPIPMGTCTGVTSSCALGGFALETRCHNGQVILYDTVQKLGWSVNIQNHGIKLVVDRLLSDTADWKVEFNGEDPGSGKQTGFLSSLGWGWRRRHPEGGDESGDKPKMREVPLPRPANEVEGVDGVCTDCFNWQFGNFKNRSLTTASRSRCH